MTSGLICPRNYFDDWLNGKMVIKVSLFWSAEFL